MSEPKTADGRTDGQMAFQLYIVDYISVWIFFLKSMWKCRFYLANCRHPIDFSKVMVQKENLCDEIIRDRPYRNAKPFR